MVYFPTKNAPLMTLFPRRVSTVHLSKLINLSHHPTLHLVSCAYPVPQMKHFLTLDQIPRNGVG